MRIRVVSWNVGKRSEPWRELARMARDGEAELALLQEAGRPPEEVVDRVGYEDRVFWNRHLYDRWPLVVRLSDRIAVEQYRQVPPSSDLAEAQIGVSGIGAIAAGRVIPRDSEAAAFVAVSGQPGRVHGCRPAQSPSTSAASRASACTSMSPYPWSQKSRHVQHRIRSGVSNHKAATCRPPHSSRASTLSSAPTSDSTCADQELTGGDVGYPWWPENWTGVPSLEYQLKHMLLRWFLRDDHAVVDVEP